MRRTSRFCLASRRVTNLDVVSSRAALLLLFVIACAGPAPSPPPVAMVRAPLPTVILQLADLPAGYFIEKDEEMSPEDLSNGLGRTVAQLKTRLAFGYVRSFTRADEPFVCCVIDSILITTADDGTARQTAIDFRERALELGSVETDLGETIGDESRAFVFEHPSADGMLITLTVLFRYLNVVDAVEVTGRPGSFERGYVLEFAKKQLQRLRADAEQR